ncbi:MAG: hypothetical protein CMI74_02700 [Candidatus Pelagibacter sp.]|nr:hypothetical protein [Candidatus Pelagibacter sp.]OUW11641.1 MAG: hypothetical protein CBD26_00930 [Candidatus Pelagibacter sp. TMED166]|tara:strand:- start:41631 stop:42797 length:1167 start_codon:yes stop_codon:yes gene_type:complete
MKYKSLGILGSTGSIGVQTLSLIKKEKSQIRLIFISCNKNIGLLKRQVQLYQPKYILIKNTAAYLKFLNKNQNLKFRIFNDLNKLVKKINGKIDFCISSIAGNDGFISTITISKVSRNLLIANKESIVLGNKILIKELKKNKCKLIPIDSEHFSIFSILDNNPNFKKNIKKIFLTASGGPFFNKKIKYKKVSVKQALKHPNWSMGKKISIDSATLANKVLEYFEALIIFNLRPEDVAIRIEPSSRIHAILLLKSGFYYFIAHNNSMKIPISHALNMSDTKFLNKKIFLDNSVFQFFKPDDKKFKLLKIAKNIAKLGHGAMIFFSIINERLVYKFLKKEITFDKISLILVQLFKNKKFISLCKTYIRSKKDILKAVETAKNYNLNINNE